MAAAATITSIPMLELIGLMIFFCSTLIVGTHSGRLEAAVCLHFLFDELLLPPKITELGGQQLPMVFYPRESDSASTKKRRKIKMNDDDIVTLSKSRLFPVGSKYFYILNWDE